MKIGELAMRSGFSASRIRFYEASGLIDKADRKANGYREYPQQTLLILGIIDTAQQAGFALDATRPLLPTADLKYWNRQDLLANLHRRLAEIAAMQRRLDQNKARLLRVIANLDAQHSDNVCSTDAGHFMAALRTITDAVP